MVGNTSRGKYTLTQALGRPLTLLAAGQEVLNPRSIGGPKKLGRNQIIHRNMVLNSANRLMAMPLSGHYSHAFRIRESLGSPCAISRVALELRRMEASGPLGKETFTSFVLSMLCCGIRDAEKGSFQAL